jgi:hypothetical protein
MTADPPKKGRVPVVNEARKTRARCPFCGNTVSEQHVIEYAADAFGSSLTMKCAHFTCWVKSEFFNPPQISGDEWEKIVREKFSRKV